MVDFSKMAARLAHIMAVCRYPTQTSLMTAIGQKSSQYGNFVSRESVATSDIRLHDVTGVDIKWLKTGEGEAFPKGPKIYSGAEPPAILDRLASLDSLTEQTATVLRHLIKAISLTTPGAAELLTQLLQAEIGSHQDSNVQVLDVALSAVKESLGGKR